MKKSFLIVLITIQLLPSLAQEKSDLKILTKAQKGIEFVAKDSLFSLRLQFRMQNRAAFFTKSENDFATDNYEFRVRRLRLKMEGFVYNPKLTYKIQLAFSRGDMDWEMTQTSTVNSSPNIVRDAVIYYAPTKSLQFGFGQTKLPGNRQRVISSGDQQFYDRSIVNATFNIDRDFGLFGSYKREYFNLSAALSSGEGRNSSRSNSGLSYTARIEALPFGKFTGRNDYQESDLERESKPKISVGASYNFNDNAVRVGGQLGKDLIFPVDISTVSLDALFKYKGFSFYGEFMQKDSKTPISHNQDTSVVSPVYVGNGLMGQVSYLFKSNWEIAFRYARVTPFKKVYDNNSFSNVNLQQSEEYILGVTKYFYGHRVKTQLNAVYQINTNLKSNNSYGKIGGIFQIELGI